MIRAYQNDRLRRRALARHHVDMRLWLSRIRLIEHDADHLRVVRQMIPLHLSFTPLSTLSASGFFVTATEPTAASARRKFDQLALICLLMLTESTSPT